MEDFELTEIVYRGTCEGIRTKVGLVGTVIGTGCAISSSLPNDVRLLGGYLAAAAAYVMYDGIKESWKIGSQIWAHTKEELKNEPPYKRKE